MTFDSASESLAVAVITVIGAWVVTLAFGLSFGKVDEARVVSTVGDAAVVGTSVATSAFGPSFCTLVDILVDMKCLGHCCYWNLCSYDCGWTLLSLQSAAAAALLVSAPLSL